MNVEKHGNFTLIRSEEQVFSEFFKLFSEFEINIQKEHLVVQFHDEIVLDKTSILSFIEIADKRKKSGTSFVLVLEGNVDDFPESLNVVPTLLEAKDVIELEEIERELGF